ncbi:probable arginine--tRNA ligase, mitochondrial [Neocloeon triangulifer]|uniref:probable arginine--tRNA ligase, mitochondrial n=1 Tax=Neocloeon triangulifer TaxID=2078957 RepID=UPI00286F66EF|nr:probable arginine--tRNA ligase, mitochondrial [Neocloeon triangulifer]
MAFRIKDARIPQIWDALKILDNSAATATVRRSSLKYNKKKDSVELHFPLASADSYEFNKISDCEVSQHGKVPQLIMSLEKSKFIPDVLDSIISTPTSFWRTSPIFSSLAKEKILVEFSSPNIAKPFHMGHLRSTIIGNFISNLLSGVGHDVVKINYLGDWGTQFGLLNVGLQLRQVTDEEIAANPIQVLYESYVLANKEAQNDKEIMERARHIFKQMEEGDFAETKRWETFRTYTIEELRRTYERLGVSFDEYQWESMFSAKDILSIIQELESINILKKSPDGKKIVKVGNRDVTLVKSDGSTLYLTRDVAAAKFRFQQHNFDRLLYVVENGQGDHFIALKDILKNMNLPWSKGITHVKFGRIHGMSTRKGEVVFLQDILDEACERSRSRQDNSKNTRVDSAGNSADVLGVSAVIINDLKQRRQRDYTFDWEKALQMQGDGGIRLQYTHCRLCSLEENSGATPADESDPALLSEPQATALAIELGRFDEVLNASYEELEACILVNYLFTLSNHISHALHHLQVKDQPPDVSSQRLRLFMASKLVLSQGLQILGIKPLQKM